MITTLLLILIIFIPSFYFYIKKNIDIERIIPCTIFTIILIIYILGLLNLLKFGVYLVFILSFLFLMLLIPVLIRKKQEVKEKIKVLLKPSILIWILAIIVLYFYYRGRMLTAWDEFSHWGDVVKMMYYNNIYSTNPASLSAASGYPPVMSIFQYFVQNLSTHGYNECLLFLAYQVFAISLTLPFIKNIKWKDVFKILLIIIVLIIVPTIFFATPYYYYNIIYIDPFLGILFAYILATIFVTKEYKDFDIISISLALFALTLTKDIAPVFSFIAVSIVFLNLIFGDRLYKTLKKINKKNLVVFFKQTRPLWIFLLVIIMSYASWKINVAFNVKETSLIGGSSIKDVILSLFSNEQTYRTLVINNYINRLSEYKFTEFGNIYMISSIMILFSILIYNKEKNDNKKKSVYSFSVIFIGEIFYVLLMLLLYLLLFSENEAVGLASFERYIGIYLTTILYFFTLITIYRSIEQKSYKNLLILLIIIILNANMPIVINNFIHNRSNKIITQDNRMKFIKDVEKVRSKVKKDEKYKFYIIIQNSRGAEKWILRYEMRDILRGMNEGFSWSLGKKYNDNDVWTLNVSKNKFKKILIDEKYDYVYLYKIDKKFVKLYGELFDCDKLKNRQLYKVDKRNIKLQLVE